MRGKLEIKELPDGYVFRLSEDAARLAEVAEWVPQNASVIRFSVSRLRLSAVTARCAYHSGVLKE